MRYIYFLLDPISNNIKYVGQTDNIDRRLKDHISSSINKNSDSYNTYKARWIRTILDSNLLPILQIIYTCETLVESNEKEKYFITKLTSEGIKLTNSHVTDVTEFSIETKAKMSMARKGKTLEEIYGVEKSLEIRNKFAIFSTEYWTGREKSDNQKLKISESLREFFKDKNNHWSYGLKMTEEHNEKLRNSHLNNPKNVGNRKPRTTIQKEKIRNKIKGSKILRYKICQYDMEANLIKIWNSLREIQRFDKSFNRSKISKCCKGEIKSYAGYIWSYEQPL